MDEPTASGAAAHRVYVGKTAQFDVMGALQFSLLCALGLREHHYVADVGCGSLRAGKFLIPYLEADRYVGMEPNTWLVDEGIKGEIGESLVALRRPRFLDNADFALADADTEFDYILAQSIFSHTYSDLFASGFKGISEALAPAGLVVATFCQHNRYLSRGLHDSPDADRGWRYPGAVSYEWSEVERIIGACGLVAARLSWAHPRQRWFVAGRDADAVKRAVQRARRAFQRPSAPVRYLDFASNKTRGALQRVGSRRRSAD